VATGIGLSMI